MGGVSYPLFYPYPLFFSTFIPYPLFFASFIPYPLFFCLIYPLSLIFHLIYPLSIIFTSFIPYPLYFFLFIPYPLFTNKYLLSFILYLSHSSPITYYIYHLFITFTKYIKHSTFSMRESIIYFHINSNTCFPSLPMKWQDFLFTRILFL